MRVTSLLRLVAALAFVQRAQNVTTDTAIAVDCYFDGHDASLGRPENERRKLEQTAGGRYDGVWYTQALLADRAQLPAFLAAMRRFGAASGQHLQLPKCRLLLLGRTPRKALRDA